MALAAEGHYSIAIVNIDPLHRKDYSTESVAADCSCINRPDSIDLYKEEAIWKQTQIETM